MDKANSIPVGTLKLGSIKNAMRKKCNVVRTNKWKFQNMTLAWCVRNPYEVSCHHTVHFCRPEEISSFFFQIWPSWSLKKRKACGFELLVKQILSNLLSIRLSALPKAHSAHPWSWWCLVEHQWCRMQEAPPVFGIAVCTHSSRKRSCDGWASAA